MKIYSDLQSIRRMMREESPTSLVTKKMSVIQSGSMIGLKVKSIGLGQHLRSAAQALQANKRGAVVDKYANLITDNMSAMQKAIDLLEQQATSSGRGGARASAIPAALMTPLAPPLSLSDARPRVLNMNPIPARTPAGTNVPSPSPSPAEATAPAKATGSAHGTSPSSIGQRDALLGTLMLRSDPDGEAFAQMRDIVDMKGLDAKGVGSILRQDDVLARYRTALQKEFESNIPSPSTSPSASPSSKKSDDRNRPLPTLQSLKLLEQRSIARALDSAVAPLRSSIPKLPHFARQFNAYTIASRFADRRPALASSSSAPSRAD